MRFRPLLATLLASSCLSISSMGQTVLTNHAYLNINLFNTQSNRNNSLTISSRNGQGQTVNGTLLNPRPFICNSINFPDLTNGFLTNCVLYAGFDYGLTNSVGDLGITFNIPTNAPDPANIAAYLTVRTNLAGNLSAYSTTASDARYLRAGTVLTNGSQFVGTNDFHTLTNGASSFALADYLLVATYNGGWGNLSTNVLGLYQNGVAISDSSADFFLPSGAQFANGSGSLYYGNAGLPNSGGFLADNNGDVHFGQNNADYTRKAFDHNGNWYQGNGKVWMDTNGLATFTNIVTATNGGNRFAGRFSGLIIANATTNASGSPVAFQSDLNAYATTSYVNTATNGFVTSAVTNGLATIAYVNTATNGFTDKTVTNGLATTSFVNVATVNAATNGSDGGKVLTTNTGWPVIVIWPMGTNFDTTNIQAAVNSNAGQGVTVRQMPGIYVITNSILMTNNVEFISSVGATNNCMTNVANFAFIWETNVTNVRLSGIKTIGGYSATGFGFRSTGVTNLASYLPNVIGFAPFVNHSGFYINMSGGGLVENCEASGFNGYGFYLVNTNAGLSFGKTMTKLSPCVSHDNYLGLWFNGWQFDNGNGQFAGNSANLMAEYTSIYGWNIYNCSQGVSLGAGNVRFVGNTLSSNFVAAAITPAVNSAHGIFVGNTINHNQYSFICSSAGSGELIEANVFYANPLGMLLAGATGLNIIGNNFDNTPVVLIPGSGASSSIANTFRNNTYQGTWGTDFVVSGFNYPSNFYSGNISSTVVGDSDGRISSGTNNQSIVGNFSVIGNLDVQGNFSGDGHLITALTNGLATVAYVNSATNGFVSASVTNGLATVSYVNASTNGFVTSTVTNGLATTAYVNFATNGFVDSTSIQTRIGTATNGLVTSAVTNGLSTIAITVTNNNSSGVEQVSQGSNTFNGSLNATNGISGKNITATNSIVNKGIQTNTVNGVSLVFGTNNVAIGSAGTNDFSVYVNGVAVMGQTNGNSWVNNLLVNNNFTNTSGAFNGGANFTYNGANVVTNGITASTSIGGVTLNGGVATTAQINNGNSQVKSDSYGLGSNGVVQWSRTSSATGANPDLYLARLSQGNLTILGTNASPTATLTISNINVGNVTATNFTGNAQNLTNIPYAKILTSTNGYFTPTLNIDGSTNWNFVLTNVPSSLVPAPVTFYTNSFASGSNIWNRPITINGDVIYTEAAVAGVSALELEISTKTNRAMMPTFVGGFAGGTTNSIAPMTVPVNGTWTTKDISSGLNNAAVAGSAQITIY